MRDWPPITNRELLERQALSDEGLEAMLESFVRALGRREFTPELYEHALAYPWERPGRSYVLRDEAATLLDDVAPGDREALIAGFARDRHPIVAFGANAAPRRLAMKLAHFDDPADRTALVLAGDLHGFDVGAGAAVTGYGSMPAAVFASPGTAVRAAVLWLTPNQVEQVTWTELTYWLARLDTARFLCDEADVAIDQVLAYVLRLGVFCPDGEPIALAAIPARNRTAPALTQEQLLDRAARIVLGEDAATAETIVRRIFEDAASTTHAARTRLWPLGRQLPPEHWTRFPAARLLAQLGE